MKKFRLRFGGADGNIILGNIRRQTTGAAEQLPQDKKYGKKVVDSFGLFK